MALSIHTPEWSAVAHRAKPVLLTGDSGVGKTFWLRVMAGLEAVPDGLRLCWDRQPMDAVRNQLRIRMHGDYWPPIWLAQTAAEELRLGLDKGPENLKHVLARWRLSSLSWDTPVHELNRQQAVRLSLAGIELAQPDLVLIDNPTASLPLSCAREIQVQILEFCRRLSCVMVVACNRWQDWPLEQMSIWVIRQAGQPPVERGEDE